MENLCILRPGSIVDNVHSVILWSFLRTFTHFLRLDGPRILVPLVSGSHLAMFARGSTGKIGLYWEMTSPCSVCSAMLGMWYMYASVYGVEEFHVFPGGNGHQTLRWIHARSRWCFSRFRSSFLRPLVAGSHLFGAVAPVKHRIMDFSGRRISP